MTSRIVKIVVICTLLVVVVGAYFYYENIDSVGDGVVPNALAVICDRDGGIWIAEFNECENITENECSMLGGDYDGCASACRNLDGVDGCIAVCVEVCSFR